MSIITDTLDGLTLGEPQAYRNLTAFPLLGGGDEAPDFLSLRRALDDGVAEVHEVSESGRVPELLFANRAGQAVLLIDGEELVGAKQNRVLNLSILVPAKSELVIPVSCVEHGRWAHRRRGFEVSADFAFSNLREKKVAAVSRSMRSVGDRRADQSEVWDEISQLRSEFRAVAPTEAMSDVYESRRRQIEDYVEGIPRQDSQVGALFAINDRIAGLDLFGYAETYGAMAEKLVRSYAVDAIRRGRRVAKVASAEAADAFLEQARNSKTQRYDAIGEGEDIRIEEPGLLGGGLHARERLLHLCVFADQTQERERDERISSLRARRSAWLHRQ